MERWLQFTPEPTKLWLAWQSPDPADRFRWAVGELTRSPQGIAFRYFAPGSEFEQHNQSRTFEAAREKGFAGYPAFSLRQRHHTEGVLEAFKRRLPPRGREDFGDYQRHLRLPTDASVSDWALLAISEGKLPNDGFSIVDPLDGEVVHRDLILEVAGFRHYAANLGNPIQLDEPVTLVPEPSNQHDPNAVAVKVRGQCVGYINRLQNRAFLRWLAEVRIEAWVSRLNGKAPNPRMFIFVQVRPSVSLAA